MSVASRGGWASGGRKHGQIGQGGCLGDVCGQRIAKTLAIGGVKPCDQRQCRLRDFGRLFLTAPPFDILRWQFTGALAVSGQGVKIGHDRL